MAMTSSMLPEEVGINYVEDKYASDSSGDYFQFVALTYLSNIATLWGDGWTAENVASGSNALHWIDGNAGEHTLKSGKSIPMLINTDWFPNLGIAVPCTKSWYDHPQLISPCVINLTTGEALSNQLISTINIDISYLSVYSFNSGVKALGGSADRGQEWSGFIVTENGIITSESLRDSDCWYYRIILPDGTYSDTEVREIMSESARTVFEPIFGEDFPSMVFDGIYQMTRGNTKTYNVVTYDNITYTIFGTNREAWSEHRMPVFVVSSEILA